jgi:hypothetical protein
MVKNKSQGTRLDVPPGRFCDRRTDAIRCSEKESSSYSWFLVLKEPRERWQGPSSGSTRSPSPGLCEDQLARHLRQAVQCTRPKHTSRNEAAERLRGLHGVIHAGVSSKYNPQDACLAGAFRHVTQTRDQQSPRDSAPSLEWREDANIATDKSWSGNYSPVQLPTAS